MLNNKYIIEQMDETELITNIDNFLKYCGIDLTNKSFNEKKKELKKRILLLKNDIYYCEYCMGQTGDQNKVSELSKRMKIDQQLILEINQYLKSLSSLKNKKFAKIKKRLFENIKRQN